MDIADLVMILSVIPKNKKQGKKHRDQFSCKKSHNSQHRCERVPFPGPYQIEKIRGTHAGSLFHKLGPCGNPGLLPSNIIAVGAGMEGAHRNGQGGDAQQIGTLLLQQDMYGKPGGMAVQQKGDGKGYSHGQGSGDQKNIPGTLFILQSDPGGHEAGDRCLDSSYCQCKTEGVDGKDKLVDTHPLCTNCLRQEYSIEKPKDFCQETGQSQDKCSFQQNMFVIHKKSFIVTSAPATHSLPKATFKHALAAEKAIVTFIAFFTIYSKKYLDRTG